MNRSRLVACLLLLPSLLAAQRPEVVYFGDSITEGWIDAERRPTEAWPAVLDSTMTAQGVTWTSVLRAVGGETSEDGLRRIDADVLQTRPRIAIIAFGSNDYYVWGAPAFRRVGKEQFKRNLTLMIEKLRGVGIIPVFLGLPPILPARFALFTDTTVYTALGGVEAGNRDYNSAMRETAQCTGAWFVECDFGEDGAQLLGMDGVHPSPAGHRRMAALLAPVMFALRDSVPEPAKPMAVSLYPVPFRPADHGRMLCAISSDNAATVRVGVVDAAGRNVRNIVYWAYSAGVHYIPWDGRTDDGTPAPAGAYTVYVLAGNELTTHRVQLF
jgi:lysophospholipase L1-like esterase